MMRASSARSWRWRSTSCTTPRSAEKLSGKDVRLHPLVRDFAARRTAPDATPAFRGECAANLLAAYRDFATLEGQFARRVWRRSKPTCSSPWPWRSMTPRSNLPSPNFYVCSNKKATRCAVGTWLPSRTISPSSG